MPDHPVREEINLLAGDFYVDRPLEHFAWMRENAPVYYDPVGKIWGVTLHEDIMGLSKRPKTFCSSKSSRPEEGSLIQRGQLCYEALGSPPVAAPMPVVQAL